MIHCGDILRNRLRDVIRDIFTQVTEEDFACGTELVISLVTSLNSEIPQFLKDQHPDIMLLSITSKREIISVDDENLTLKLNFKNTDYELVIRLQSIVRLSETSTSFQVAIPPNKVILDVFQDKT